MSITPAERRGYDDRLRQTREEYENREAEGLKQRNEEMRRLEKRHHDEVKQLSESYEERLGETQGRNREVLSDRDLKHQQDMEDLRTTSMSQLRRKMEENATQRRELEESYRSELEKTKETGESQRSNLTERQTSELEKRDQHLEKVFADAHRLAQEGIEQNRNNLGAAHEKEENLLRKDRNEAVARKEADLRMMKKNYEDQLRLLQDQKAEGEVRATERYENVVRKMGDSQDGDLGIARAQMVTGLREQHDKYEAKLQEKTAEIDRNNEAFRSDIKNRQETQVRSRDSKIGELENRLNNQMVQSKRQGEVEKNNVIRSYEARLDDLARQKEEVARSSNDAIQDRVNLTSRASNKLLNETTRQHRDEVALLNSQNREDRETLISTHQDQLAHNTKAADRRIRFMERDTQGQIKTISDHYDESLGVLKDGYAQKIEDQRDSHLDEQNRLTSVMTNRFRDLENKSQQRLDLTVENYENKLAMQKDTHDKDMKRLEASYEQRLSDMKKGSKLEKESVEQKYEAKLAMSDARHQEELEKLNRRHEDEIRSAVTRTASSFSRKA